ncbi:hypothetical protein F511_11887 [Dorcoceras hygrometricum]|uniref:Uncharacterized protein n=1 Tax=Dorcoceras hygrometricum TaxID=472368 RepID=A0A2Z7CZ40_9LAMI|nr:hypothetical protein F511_11887 [Dorcoceras hygrometricum]
MSLLEKTDLAVELVPHHHERHPKRTGPDINAGLKVNWPQFLFQILIAMVHSPSRQRQVFDVQLSVLQLNLLKADLGESAKLHPLKLLNSKSVHTYMKKNLGVGPAGETSKVSGATTSEQQSAIVSLPSLTSKAEKEVGETTKPEKAAVRRRKRLFPW